MTMKIHLSKSGYFILMAFDDHRTVEIDFGAKTAKEAMRGYRKEHDDVLRYMTRSVTLTLIRRAKAGDTIMAGPETVQGQAHVPRREIVTRQETAEKTRLRAQADKDHEEHHQYRNHWNGPEWRLARCKRDVRAKGGPAALAGDIVLAKVDALEVTFYSWRNKYNTRADPRCFEFLEPEFKPVLVGDL